MTAKIAKRAAKGAKKSLCARKFFANFAALFAIFAVTFFCGQIFALKPVTAA